MTEAATDLKPGLSRDELLARVRRLQIRARRLVRVLFLGEYHSVFRGRGTTYVKKFVEERELTVYLLVDLSASSLFSTTAATKRDLAAELATLLAFAALANNDRVGLILFTDRVELYLRPRKLSQQALRIARELVDARPASRGTNLASAADFLMRVAKRPGVAFILSDFHARDYEAPLRLAAQKHDVIAISLSDPRELTLPRAGLVRLRDPETDAEVLIDTEDRRERERFAVAAREAAAARRRSLRALGVDEVAVRTDRSYIEPLMAFFKSRERRRLVSA